jgi:hypothetical protein
VRSEVRAETLRPGTVLLTQRVAALVLSARVYESDFRATSHVGIDTDRGLIVVSIGSTMSIVEEIEE